MITLTFSVTSSICSKERFSAPLTKLVLERASRSLVLPPMVLVICRSVTHSWSCSHVCWNNWFCRLCHSFVTFLRVHAPLSHLLVLFLVLLSACEQLTHRMEQLLGNRSTDYYMKTIACVQAFREQSIKVNAQSRLNILLGFTLQSILAACSFSGRRRSCLC